MIEDQYISIAGTIGTEPELRFTPGGAAVCNFSVAVNHRRFNRDSGQWEQTGTDWHRVNVWRQQAENVSESFKKGDRVWVYGKLASREWEDRNGGGKRLSWEITAEECGHSCKFAPTSQHRPERSQQQGGGQQGNQGQYGGRGGQQGAQDDPWGSGYQDQPNYGGQQQGRPQGGQQQTEDPWASTPPPATQGGFADEPPF